MDQLRMYGRMKNSKGRASRVHGVNSRDKNMVAGCLSFLDRKARPCVSEVNWNFFESYH